MLKAIAAYLEIFSRAIIVSRGLGANSGALDEIHRLSIITYLGEPNLAAQNSETSAAACTGGFGQPKTA